MCGTLLIGNLHIFLTIELHLQPTLLLLPGGQCVCTCAWLRIKFENKTDLLHYYIPLPSSFSYCFHIFIPMCTVYRTTATWAIFLKTRCVHGKRGRGDIVAKGKRKQRKMKGGRREQGSGVRFPMKLFVKNRRGPHARREKGYSRRTKSRSLYCNFHLSPLYTISSPTPWTRIQT